ncbi:MAG TPA: 6-phosphofructokinase [Oligoflexia bacterium]|nr:6-phosphofructokinase [Oligoflexia bacterium]HMP49819.1 6-phosphofructokinase [Oligoflexia bacterium]
MKRAFAIVVGGGPAPGINGVISAVTIEAINAGHKVYGIWHGFKRIASGDESCIQELSISDVAWIPREGGSILATSRSNPRAYPDMMENIGRLLREKNVGYLVAIGGDGTAACASAISDSIGGDIAVVHVPKTIDNDLPLPGEYSTFGFQSAREVGTEIVETLMVDAKTTGRWYLVVAMGRKAGHLAMGIGVAAGATLSVVPEEFRDQKYPLGTIADIVVGSVIKRMLTGRPYGVAVLAEGLADVVDPESLPELSNAERDFFGNIRFAEFDFGDYLKVAVREKLADLGLAEILMVSKNVGYELRCRPPNPFDREYTRMLGFGAVKFLLEGGNKAMIARVGASLHTIPFSDFIDHQTGKAAVRMLNTESMFYKMARSYQIRLTVQDLKNKEFLSKFSSVTSRSEEYILERFMPIAVTWGGFE